jgi:polyphosphate glucokinase
MGVTRKIVGVDVGGTGVKAAVVDVEDGALVTERTKVKTPSPSTPKRVAEVIAQLVEDSPTDAGSPVGVTLPAVVRNGMVSSAANIDPAWIGTDACKLLETTLDRPVRVVNDADAAGYAETAFGAAAGRQGVVLVTTLGTGIGSALIHNGVLVPNTELGHLEIDGHDAESRASNGARERKDLSWEEWAERLTRYYRMLEHLFSPDLFVVGGGVSKQSARFLSKIAIDTEIVPAILKNSAGIIGAAMLTHQDHDG